MKRALYIRNVSSPNVPLDSLDNACIQTLSSNSFSTKVVLFDEDEIFYELMQKPRRGQSHAMDAAPAMIIPATSSYVGSYTTGPHYDTVLFRASGMFLQTIFSVLRLIRTVSRQIFVCVMSAQLVEDAMGRYRCFEQGASMVTNSLEDIRRVMKYVVAGTDNKSMKLTKNEMSRSETSRHENKEYLSENSSRSIGGQGSYRCPFCDKPGFTEDQLWRHCPLYHINEPNRDSVYCPICRQLTRGPFQVHLHNAHGPPGRGEATSEFDAQDSLLFSFALVVCHNRKYNRFLLVQEFANSGYWLPGGRIDGGENPVEAAIRETKEEAGIDIRITGLLKMEYHPRRDRGGSQYVRMRFVFYAEPVDSDQLPKSIPDYESVGATWVQADEVKNLPLRGPEPNIYFSYIAAGHTVYPLDLLCETTTSLHGQATSKRRKDRDS